ncbi:MAG: 1-acyl-sn-glycerol-3-phosphate acyltransferase [Pseudomonadales bacterium]|nr:1-acyl-sn-glycerol-3-phosphate acyltransferase [Pseudomonadales bacterium]
MKYSEMAATRHLVSVASWIFITLNLLIWLPFLLLAAFVRLVCPVNAIKALTDNVVDAVYRIATRIDGWWIERVLGVRFEIEDEDFALETLRPHESPMIIANHRSWFDIFTLQTLICRRGPMLKFLIKTELLWVPVLGWVCIALNFPRLQRKGDQKTRTKDLGIVQKASVQLGASPGALLLFPEGTRYTEEKRVQNGAPYKSLLRPKPGGFNTILLSLPDSTSIIDFSIGYEPGDDNCWRCMSGLVNIVRVKVSQKAISGINGIEWLEDSWQQKDEWLAGTESSRK